MKKDFLDYWAELNWKNRFNWQSQIMAIKIMMRWGNIKLVNVFRSRFLPIKVIKNESNYA
jgi:hypothetical protein